MTTERRPLHLGVLIGVSAGAYAISLAGVTALQAAEEQAVAAQRAPAAAALELLGAHHDGLEATLAGAAGAYGRSAEDLATLTARLAAVEGSLDALAVTVGDIEGAAAALPARIALPRVNASAGTYTRPATNATTGASGAP